MLVLCRSLRGRRGALRGMLMRAMSWRCLLMRTLTCRTVRRIRLRRDSRISIWLLIRLAVLVRLLCVRLIGRLIVLWVRRSVVVRLSLLMGR